MMKLYESYDLNNPFINSQQDLVFALQLYHTYKTIINDEFRGIAQRHSINLKSNDSLIGTAQTILDEAKPTNILLP